MILRRKILFSPERRSKVVKFAKNDRLDALIVLARDEQFLFFPWKRFKGGTIGWFFAGWNPTVLLVFHLFIIFLHLTRIIQSHKIVTFIYTDTLAPFMYFVSQYTVNTWFVVVAVCVAIIINYDDIVFVFSFILIVFIFKSVDQMFKYSISLTALAQQTFVIQ